MDTENVLSMQNITKRFPGVLALDHAQIHVKKGEVHALMGENGAGKSTLVKILGGIYHADSGEIFIDGQQIKINSVADAEQFGISIIHQEISLVNSMTIGENIFLGREPTDKFGLYDGKQLNRDAKTMLMKLKINNLNPSTKVIRLSIAQMQMVEIIRAVSKNPKIIVMDEPTASLTDKEVKDLFNCIKQLKSEGVAVIYISHRLNEVFEIADRVTVFRDSRYIGTKNIKETNVNEVIHMMVGRDLTELYAGEIQYGHDILFEAKHLKNRHLKDVSFKVRKGEIFGICGLVGAKRTELARSIFGIDKLDSGELFLNGLQIFPQSPQKAIRYGISLVPEDRKKEGLILIQTVRFNMTLAVLSRFIRFIFHDKKQEDSFVDEYVRKLSIKTPTSSQIVKNLSGGNQQKVVISKWLATEPKLLILDEPTRGVDVGAKSEIYHLMNQIARNGVSIIMISSDLQEIINMSSRIAVMHEGELATILDTKCDDISQNNIMFYATGGKKNEHA